MANESIYNAENLVNNFKDVSTNVSSSVNLNARSSMDKSFKINNWIRRAYFRYHDKSWINDVIK